MDITQLLSLVPAKYAGVAGAIVSFAIAAANLALALWKPPAPSSKWLLVYRAVKWVALSRGWNENAYQSGAKAIMAPVDMKRTDAASKLGLDPVSTRPDSKKSPSAVG